MQAISFERARNLVRPVYEKFRFYRLLYESLPTHADGSDCQVLLAALQIVPRGQFVSGENSGEFSDCRSASNTAQQRGLG
jgi:hypothetical protein